MSALPEQLSDFAFAADKHDRVLLIIQRNAFAGLASDDDSVNVRRMQQLRVVLRSGASDIAFGTVISTIQAPIRCTLPLKLRLPVDTRLAGVSHAISRQEPRKSSLCRR